MSEVQKVKFACDECGKTYTWKPEIAGRKAKCKCGAVMVVPKTNPAKAKPRPPVAAEPEMDEFEVAESGGDTDDLPAVPVTYDPAPAPAAAPRMPAAMPATAAKTAAGKSNGLFNGINSFVPDNDNWKWWYYIIGGFAMVPCAFMEYFRLVDYEHNQAQLNLKSFEQFLYGVFGKWGVCGFTVVIGAICIVIGLAKWSKERQEAAAK